MRAATMLGVLAAAAAIAGCGGDDGGGQAVPASAGVEREVRRMFADYSAAMAAGDYARACAHLAPESIRSLRDAGPPDTSCPELLETTAKRADPDARAELATVARTAKVEHVFANPGRSDAVVIAWAAEVDGRRVPVQQPARRVDGAWKLIGAGSDSP